MKDWKLGILLLSSLLLAPSVAAIGLDTQGTLSIECPSRRAMLLTHSYGFDGTGHYEFIGECDGSNSKEAWNLPYRIKATWDGQRALELVTIGKLSGQMVSRCPSDPWRTQVQCTRESISGSAFETLMQPAKMPVPLSAEMVSASQRAALLAEATAKQAMAFCEPPRLLSLQPGGQLPLGKVLTIEWAHHPKNPPQRWAATWAAPTKPGGPPSTVWPSVDLNLESVLTSGGKTVVKIKPPQAGTWTFTPVHLLQAQCEKVGFPVPTVSVTVTELLKKPGLDGKRVPKMTLPDPGLSAR